MVANDKGIGTLTHYNDLPGVDLFLQLLCVHWHQQSREILALSTERSLFLAYHGVCESGTKINIARYSEDRTNMAAHAEKPELSLYTQR